MEEIKKVTIKVKAGNKKGFLINEEPDQWYTANKEVIDDLAKVNKGDEVEITYTSKGVFRNVSKIVKVGKEEAKAEPVAAVFVCEECGASLKDNKYKKCYLCNKKAKDNPKPEPVKETKSEVQESKSEFTCEKCGVELKDNKYKLCYSCNQKEPRKDNAIVGMRLGNALNATASILGGRTDIDIEVVFEMLKVKTLELYTWVVEQNERLG